MSSSSPNHAEAIITSVGPNEASRLIGLVRAFHEESGHAVGPEQAEAIRQLCANSTLGQAWVLTIDDRDIGYGLVYFRHSIDHGGRIAVLDDLWITADRRGQGHGGLLLRTICENLQAMGARAVILEATLKMKLLSLSIRGPALPTPEQPNVKRALRNDNSRASVLRERRSAESTGDSSRESHRRFALALFDFGGVMKYRRQATDSIFHGRAIK